MENLPQQPQRDPGKDKQKVVGLMLFEAGMEFAGLIAVPLIGFILLGRWLDHKYNTHFIVIIGILLALTVSVLGIAKKIKDYKKILDNK